MKTVIAALALSWCLFSSLVSARSGADDKGMFQGNAAHTGVYNAKPVIRYDGLRFVFPTGGPIRSTPVIVDGVVYFGSADGHLYAVDAQTGTERWRCRTGGAVESSPAVLNHVVYFTSRDGFLHAVGTAEGNELWKHKMGDDLPYTNGFDYYCSSPTVDRGILFVGSGDGCVYAIESRKGTVRWRFDAKARIRSTPAVVDNFVLVGTVDGYLLALDRNTGSLKWKFATRGSSLLIKDFGYDRSAIISSPSVVDSVVTFGCRDGYLYAVDLRSGKELWNFNHEISWVISTPARSEGFVYAGSSDGQFFQSVDEKTGLERWRFKTGGPVWASGAIAGPVVYVASNDGKLYALDKTTGAMLWKFGTGDRIFSSPVALDGIVYFGCDDGNLYALSGATSPEGALPRKAVFWESDSSFSDSWFPRATEESIRDFFKQNGYQVVDARGLEQLMKEGISDGRRSVVVFSQNRVPENIVKEKTEKALIRQYLDRGGKIVFAGTNPSAYVRDSTGQVQGLNFEIPQRVFGIQYPGSRLEGIGWYAASATSDGKKWGLNGWWVGLGWVSPEQVTTVLARDENGNAAAWVKNYGGPEGSGLVQLFIPRGKHVDAHALRNVAEYGLWR